MGDHKGKRNIGIRIVRPNVIVFIGYGHGDGIVAGVRLNVTGNLHRSGIEAGGSIGLLGTRVCKLITVRGRFRELRFFDGKLFGLGGSCRIVRRFFPFNGHGIFTGFFRGCCRTVFCSCVSLAGISYGFDVAFLNTFDDKLVRNINFIAVSPTGNRYRHRSIGFIDKEFEGNFLFIVVIIVYRDFDDIIPRLCRVGKFIDIGAVLCINYRRFDVLGNTVECKRGGDRTIDESGRNRTVLFFPFRRKLRCNSNVADIGFLDYQSQSFGRLNGSMVRIGHGNRYRQSNGLSGGSRCHVFAVFHGRRNGVAPTVRAKIYSAACGDIHKAVEICGNGAVYQFGAACYFRAESYFGLVDRSGTIQRPRYVYVIITVVIYI